MGSPSVVQALALYGGWAVISLADKSEPTPGRRYLALRDREPWEVLSQVVAGCKWKVMYLVDKQSQSGPDG